MYNGTSCEEVWTIEKGQNALTDKLTPDPSTFPAKIERVPN